MTTTTVKKLLRAGSAMLLASLLGGAGLLASTGRAQADPVWHQVTYTVSAKNPIYADIYYQDQDPAAFSDYSHNPYTFTPNIQADITPGKPWVQQVPLLNPDQWAMVTVSTGHEPGTPMFHCDLSVDGVVVVSKDGPRGCSVRCGPGEPPRPAVHLQPAVARLPGGAGNSRPTPWFRRDRQTCQVPARAPGTATSWS